MLVRGSGKSSPSFYRRSPALLSGESILSHCCRFNSRWPNKKSPPEGADFLWGGLVTSFRTLDWEKTHRELAVFPQVYLRCKAEKTGD
jgi:hypothetical protein